MLFVVALFAPIVSHGQDRVPWTFDAAIYGYLPTISGKTKFPATGNSLVVQAGSEVKNFEQIKVGDQVVARYIEAVTLSLKKGTGAVRERIEREDTVAATPGEKPGMASGRQVTVIADVIAVDAAKQTVHLRGPQRTVDLKVRDPAQFKLVKVGDRVEATFSEAVALAVEPAPAATPAKLMPPAKK